MSDMNDWNTWNKSVIAEFRASEGRVGGNLEGMPMVLVHHFGRKSGQEYVNPLAWRLPGPPVFRGQHQDHLSRSTGSIRYRQALEAHFTSQGRSLPGTILPSSSAPGRATPGPANRFPERVACSPCSRMRLPADALRKHGVLGNDPLPRSAQGHSLSQARRSYSL
jgi:hypothetical protein